MTDVEYLRKHPITWEELLALEHTALATFAHLRHNMWLEEREENTRLNRRILELQPKTPNEP